MPGKPRRGQGKHSARSKKRKKGQHFSALRAEQQRPTQRYEPVSEAPTPSAKVSIPRSSLTPVQYPHITAELRRIAILAGIMLAVLVVLSLVIS